MLSVGVLIVEHMLLMVIEIVLHNAVGLLRTVFKGIRWVCNESPPTFNCEGGIKNVYLGCSCGMLNVKEHYCCVH